jgi:CRISPR-associated endonuclease/helicase Cas3
LSDGWPTLCYHSRYRLCDRRDRHNALIESFKEAARNTHTPQPILGTTTQVCEMSLDVDADVLITEVAPISALIQRMGRCNRDNGRMLRESRIGTVFVIRREQGRDKPYDSVDLDAADSFVSAIVGRPVSQEELERVFQQHDNRVVEPDKLCPFLDSGAYAQAGEDSFRDIDEFTVPCVLDGGDLQNVLAALRHRTPIDRFIVPVPHRYVANDLRPEDPRFPRWLSVARPDDYDALTGFGPRAANN